MTDPNIRGTTNRP